MADQVDVSIEVGWELTEQPEPEPEPQLEPQPEPRPKPPPPPAAAARTKPEPPARSARAPLQPEPEPEPELPPLRPAAEAEDADEDPRARIWVGSWNTAVKEGSCADLCGPVDSFTHGALQRTLDTFAQFVPRDCDIYIMGLQEGSPEHEGEYFFSQLELYLRRHNVRHVPPANGHPGKIYGRGDGSFISPKFTGIRVYCSDAWREHVSVVGAAGASAGMNEGSKGAVGMLIRVKDSTLLAISSHLAKHDPQKRRDQYGDLCRKLAEGLAAPSVPSSSSSSSSSSVVSGSPSGSASSGGSAASAAGGGGGIGDLHCQYHHMIWFGDMNYHIKKVEDDGCTVDEAVSCIRRGELQALYHYDELFHDLDLMESRPTERKPLCFCGFVEPERWVSGPLATRFYPTYKKDSKRGTHDAKGGGGRFVVPRTAEDIVGERDWVRRVYNIDYTEHWYKGGGTKLRMPSWTDRILYRSMPHLKQRLVPSTRGSRSIDSSSGAGGGGHVGGGEGEGEAMMDRYRAVNDVLLCSDHSPVCAVFELQPEDCRTEPHYTEMTVSIQCLG